MALLELCRPGSCMRWSMIGPCVVRAQAAFGNSFLRQQNNAPENCFSPGLRFRKGEAALIAGTNCYQSRLFTTIAVSVKLSIVGLIILIMWIINNG